MNYILKLPPEVENRLSIHATQTGQDVLQLIQLAVTRFVEQELSDLGDEQWSDDLNARRCLLIDKDLSGQISIAERIELVSLQKRAESYFDRVAPPDMETVTRLHQELRAKADSANGNH